MSAVGAALDADLPDVFQLTTVVPPLAAGGPQRRRPRLCPATFEAPLQEDGTVRLSGLVQGRDLAATRS